MLSPILSESNAGIVGYDPTIYRGSAAHYRAGRPPYSAELERTLTDALGLDGQGRLLDCGCGPGILTVRLAGLFYEAVGLDPDADMLDEARRAAGGAGVENVRWVQAQAEDLPGAARGPYRLVTFGQSFHWTQEDVVAEIVSTCSSREVPSPSSCTPRRADRSRPTPAIRRFRTTS